MTEPPSPLRMLLSPHTKRRAFITLLDGAAVAGPLAARAQQGERMRRIAIFMNLASNDAEGHGQYRHGERTKAAIAEQQFSALLKCFSLV